MADASTRASDQSQVPALPWPSRAPLWIAIGGITAIAWLYLKWMPMTPAAFGGLTARLLGTMSPGVADALLMFMMWAVMMVAMMLPSAAPMIETYARAAPPHAGFATRQVWLFAAAYIVVWTAFSAIATATQFALQRVGAVNAAMTATPWLGAAILLAAGIYQITPLKNVCLTSCRSPLGFLMAEWRDGARGAFVMGLRHGAMCLGCCWMLMLLLFVFGVMNLIWVAALSVFVLLEKVLPGGRIVARASGIAMMAGGLALLI